MYNQIHILKQYSPSFGFSFGKVLMPSIRLSAIVEKWCKTLDGGETEAVVTDHSKAFDCIDHSLLITKFNAYGFGKQ